MKKKKQCILILGMHRSGTSALAQALHSCGIYFGKALAPPSFDNPKGFFENYKIQELNDLILQELQSSWDDVDMLPEAWIHNDQLKEYSKKAQSIIEKEFSRHTLFCIKDPRNSLLLPFWKRVFDQMGISLLFIIILRNPQEIARSLKQRNHFSHKKSYLLTSRYLIEAEAYSRDSDRVLTSYDALLKDPVKALKNIFDRLNHSFPSLSPDPSKLNSIIDINLRSQDAEQRANIISALPLPVASHIDELYELLGQVTENDRNTLYTKFEKSRLRHLQLVKEAKLQNSPENQYYSKLLLDNGQGFNEKNAYSKLIDREKEWIVYSLKDSKDLLSRLKFIPVNAPCQLTIDSFKVDFSNDPADYKISINSQGENKGAFYFHSEYPQIIITFARPVALNSFQVRVGYLKIGPEVGHTLKWIKKDKSSWITEAIASTLKHPFRFIKSINLQNFKTLRSALRRESPKEILRNFIKLLERKETQQQIEAQAESNKESLLKNDSNEPGNLQSTVNNNDSFDNEFITRRDSISIAFPQVLYVTPHLPEFDTSSGGQRATKMLKILAKICDVSVLSLGSLKNKYVNTLTEYGVSVISNRNYKSIKKHHPRIDIIIYAWYYSYHEAKRLLEIYPDARTIIDTVDIHWVREKRSIGIWDGIDEGRVEKNKLREVAAYAKVDLIWVVSEPDRDAVLEELPLANIRTVSNIHDVNTTDYADPGNNNILFFGGFNHYPNLSAVHLLAKDIFPIVRKSIPDAQLLIAGSHATKEVADLGMTEGIQYLGFIDQVDIKKLYDKTFLCVAPILAGAGIKGKITEAISYMTPVVTNDLGNEGIHLVNEESGLITNDYNRMASMIIQAMQRKYDLKSITSKARKRLVDITGIAKAKKQIESSIYPEVDICIVTWNGIGLIKACINSVIANTSYPNYNLIIYSNGCTDGTQEFLKDLEKKHNRISCILSDRNDVFVLPNNELMRFHRKTDIVLLNNDVTVTQGWLRALQSAAYCSKQIGIAGSKILYPNGTLQEFGSEIFEDGTGRNIGKRDDHPHREEYSTIKAVGYVSGCSMYIKRSTIDRIGVFDQRFHPCYFEDSDFCYSAWEQDILTIVTPSSVVYHQEGATAGISETGGYKQYQKINQSKFLSKHGENMNLYKRKISAANRKLHVKILPDVNKNS